LNVTSNDNSLRGATVIFVYNLDERQFSGGCVILLKGKCEGMQRSSVPFQHSTWRPAIIESVAVVSASLRKTQTVHQTKSRPPAPTFFPLSFPSVRRSKSLNLDSLVIVRPTDFCFLA